MSIQVGISPAPSIPIEKLDTHERATDSSLIDFKGLDDPYNALNWPMKKKIVATMLYSFCTMGASWASTMSVALLFLVMISYYV
jgi:hypothetical protein